MGENVDIQSSIALNSVTFLQNLSEQAALQVPALKSFYLTKSRLIEFNKSVQLPKEAKSRSGKCNKCLINFQNDAISCKITKIKKSKFAKKLLLKQLRNKGLTDFQRKYIKKCVANDNNLVIQCRHCKKERKIPMKKPILKPIIVDTPVVKTAKKKKKMSRFCGLNEKLVLSYKKKGKKGKLKPLKLHQESPKKSLQDNSVIVIEDTPKKSAGSLEFKNIIIKDKTKQVNSGKIVKNKDKALEKSIKNLKKHIASPLGKNKEKPANKLQAFLKGIGI